MKTSKFAVTVIGLLVFGLLVMGSQIAMAGNGNGKGSGGQGTRQIVYQTTILQLVALKLDVDYNTFYLEYNNAKAVALAFANTISVRPINMQAKLLEYLASSLNLSVIDIESAFYQAKAEVFGT